MSPPTLTQPSAVHELIADRLRSIGYEIDGAPASALSVRRLFSAPDLSSLITPPNVPPPLSPLFCEEHLAAALTVSRQVIQERQLFWAAGERFAALALSLRSDEAAKMLLELESQAMAFRRTAATAARDGEVGVCDAALQHRDGTAAVSENLKPDGQWAKWDAHREYIANLYGLGATGHLDYWDQSAQVDNPAFLRPQPTDPHAIPFVIDASVRKRIVGLELASRTTKARFRVAQDGASLAVSAATVAHLASKARLDVLSAAAEFESNAASIATKRSELAAALLAQKQAMASDISLLGFQGQMMLHRNRAADLHAEASERAAHASEGIRTVYGLELPAVPATTIDSAEELLSWTRFVARNLLGFEPKAVRQRVTLSALEGAGASWRKKISSGVALDAGWLAQLGNVVRLRNVSVRFFGSQRRTLRVQVTTPQGTTAAPLSDRDVTGQVRNTVIQPSITFEALAANANDRDVSGQASAARAVHNLCPTGVWRIRTSDVLTGVDDVLLDLEISYLYS